MIHSQSKKVPIYAPEGGNNGMNLDSSGGIWVVSRKHGGTIKKIYGGSSTRSEGLFDKFTESYFNNSD